MGAGADWDWGIWELEGLPQSVSFASPAIISPVDFNAITAGAATYNLTGGGTAAAVIRESGLTKLVQGGCSLAVQVGGMPVSSASWNGTFSMSNIDGDALSFQAGGLFAPDGAMNANVIAYDLFVNGSGYGIGTVESGYIVGGRLVGPGVGGTPITGATGNFHFQNSAGAALVDGGYGADLF